MKERRKLAASLVLLATLVLFPWSGRSVLCGGGCVTEYISPLGLRYPEWLGILFYIPLVLALGWLILTPFRRLDRREVDRSTTHWGS